MRKWSIRDLSARSGVSTKTIVNIEKGLPCTIKTEEKLAKGFNTYIGRLWDAELLSSDEERFISDETGRWFFADHKDAEQHHKRKYRYEATTEDSRFRGDPDEIQDPETRRRLGRNGMAKAFVKAMGGGLAAGYFQFNVCEIYARDCSDADGLGYCYLAIAERGSVRFGIRGKEFELHQGDSISFRGNAPCWFEPAAEVERGQPAPLVYFICLGVLPFRKESAAISEV